MINIKNAEGWRLSVLTTGTEHEGKLLIHDPSEKPYLLKFHGALQIKVKGQVFSGTIVKIEVSEHLIFTHKHILSELQKPSSEYRSVLVQISSELGGHGEVTGLCQFLTLQKM